VRLHGLIRPQSALDRGMLTGKQHRSERQVANPTIWLDFIKALRAEQDELRGYLVPFEAGTQKVGRGGVDWTANEIATVKREIASLQDTIDRVIIEQGLSDA
jgi:hypothetical protein